MNFIRFILVWKYHLLVIGLIAGLLSAFFSSKLFVTPLYKSFAVVYPTNIYPYSDETETEQMLQLFNSGDIRDSIIRKFELRKRYGIKASNQYYLSTLFYVYSQRISIRKTEFESVVINVLDADPKVACDIVNAILHYYDLKVRSVHKLKFKEVLDNFELVLAKKRVLLDSIQNSIDDITVNKGLPKVKVPDLNLIKSFSTRVKDSIAIEDFDKNIVRRMRSGTGSDGELVMLVSLAMSEAEAYSEFKLKYDEAVLNYNREYTYSTVVSPPFVSDKKVYPKVWLIISLSVLATLFLSIVIISYWEDRKKKPESAPVAQ